MKTKTWREAYDSDWEHGADLDCSQNELTSLEGAPEYAAGSFDCSNNELTSLKGAPSKVEGNFVCSRNKLTSLEGAPSYVGHGFYCLNSGVTSLKDIHLHIKHIGGRVHFDGNPIKSHVLGLLLIDGIRDIAMVSGYGKGMDGIVEDILDRHLPSKGMESVLLAQEELILAGLEEYAQL